MKKLLLLLCLALLSLCLLCACDSEENAVGVSGVEINENGEAVVTLTDGTTHNAGVPAHGHTYGSWTDYSAENSTVGCDRRVYYRTCSGCGDLEWKTGGAHSFAVLASTPATCTAAGSETKSCTVCGETQTDTLPILPHAYQSTYSHSGSHHWYQCTNCDAVKGKNEHTAGAGGLCAVCHNPTGPTEGILYAVNGDHAEVLGYTGTATKILIADTYQDRPVTAIGANAFKEKNIISVIIPASVTSIGYSAFSSCYSLTAVTFAANSQLQSVGSYAFYDCGLTSVTIPAGVTSIGYEAFSSCDRLTAVTFAANSQLQSIGSSAFYWCSKLTAITIPASVTSIGDSAFEWCDSLTSVTFAPNSQLQSIGSDAFSLCGLTSVTIPASVTSIGEWAFSSCDSLTAVIFAPNSQLQSIGDEAFEYCDSLTSVAIPASVTSIGNDAFSGCSKLTSVIFESKTGWTAGSTPVTADMLNDPALAAVYLTATYVEAAWRRTVS